MAVKRKKDEAAAVAAPKKKQVVQEAKPEKEVVKKTSEEEDFPRGGASALTPAEIREARQEADAEFEKEKDKRPGKKRRESKGGKGEAGYGDGFYGNVLAGKLQKSVEILRYKSLVVGMKIWGVIVEINNKDMVISLPGGLRGFVLASEASELFANSKARSKMVMKQSKKRRKMVDAECDPAEAGLDEEDEVPFLLDMFNVGQLVACTVRKLELSKAKNEHGKDKDGKNDKKGRRIELSLRLNFLHEGLSIEAVHEGQALNATVTSIEDHGYLLSFGVPAMSGFLLHSNYMDGRGTKLRKGQLVQGVVISVDKKRGAVGLKASPGLVANNMAKEFTGLTMELLIPGAMVNARVRAVLKDGLLLSFLTYFTGTVDIFHLADPLPGVNWSEKYSENQRLKARILFVDPIAKAVGLTLNPQLLNHGTPSSVLEVGDVLKDAIVHRVDSTIGMLLELPTKEGPAAGYVHISNVTDAHIAKLEKKYAVGKKVRARIIGFRVMDALAIVSLKESVVEQLLLSHADVKPGMIVRGTVAVVESFGALIQLAEGVRGLCPLQHMSEFERTTPSAKFQVGAKLKFRVLTCDHQTKKISLTHKKTMVTSKLSPITSYEGAVEGLVTHGCITGIEEFGCFVSFYNEVKGLAHKSELGLDAGVKADTVYQVGQSIKCRVLRSDPLSRRLSISFVTTSTRDNGVEGEGVDIKPGEIVSGTVAHITDNVIIVDIPMAKGSAKGYLTFPHLSDNIGHIDQIKAILKVGAKFDRLLVLEVTDKQKLIVSAKLSLILAAAELPSDISQVQAQSVVPGFIANITERGCFVRFLGRLTGLASVPQVADEFVSDPSNHFSIGQSVRAQVLEVHMEKGKFSLCLKQSVCFSTDASLIHGYFLDEEKIIEASGGSNVEWTESLAIGSSVAGEVQEIKDYGVIINMPGHNDVVGFVTHYQLGGPVEVGKSVQARVLDIVKADGIVDLTLRPELLQLTKQEISEGESRKKKRANPSGTLELQQKVAALVELVKDDYLVLSLPEQGNTIGFAATGDYNLRPKDSHQRYRPGQKLIATVQHLGEKATGMRVLLLPSSSSDSQVIHRSPKKAHKESKYEIGSVVAAEVVSIEQLYLILQVGTSMGGRIHITEIKDDYEEGNPLSSFTVGQKVKGKVLRKIRVKKTPGGPEHVHILELSMRSSQLSDILEADMGAAKSGNLPTLNEITRGQVLTAYVQEVTEEWAWLLVAPHLRGRLFVLDSSTNPKQLANFQDRFKVGTAVSCRVKSLDQEKGVLDLTLKSTAANTKKAEFEVPQIDDQDVSTGVASTKGVEIEKGDILGGRVARVNPGVGGLSVQIAPSLFGRVHVTHLSDFWQDDPATGFKEGQFVTCVVLEVGKSLSGRPQVDLTLRPSLGGSPGTNFNGNDKITSRPVPPVINSITDLKVGSQAQGFLKSATSKGCFVTLAPHVDARILVSNLSDTFVQDISEKFPPGKVVIGRILSVDTASSRVEMTLKSVDGLKKSTTSVLGRRFEDFKEGDIVICTVKRIEKFGLFLSIEKSSVVGMCHVSEIADHYVKDINKHYKAGDRVRARVVKIDTANERISLGLKESYFSEADMNATVESEEEPLVVEAKDSEDIEDDIEVEKLEDKEELNADLQNNSETNDTDEDDEVSEEGEELDLDDEDEDEHEDEENEPDKTQLDNQTSALMDAPSLQVQLDEDMTPGGRVDENDEEENTEDEGSEDAKKVTKRAKKRVKEERELEIRAAEEKRLKGDQAPETMDEFEALVRTSPNSSFVWIKYMAFMLQLADVEKARAIAERALQTINYRDEAEKFNVWIAYLNLENVYGKPPKEAVLELFQKALLYNDTKKLYFALLGIYENPKQPQGVQHDMADQLLKTMTRKFNTSAKVWLKQIQSLLARGMGDAAHKALDQSLLSLPRRKHIKVISQAALLEFKIGSVERARSMFEGILRNYPKRTDLWSVYLDQEIRVGENTVIRALFERVICLELPARKMKFLFKKYLDYEKQHGDESRVEHVKNKAMEYVDTKLG